MKKLRNYLAPVALTIALVLSLTACGGFTAADAQTMVQGEMDTFHGTANSDFLKIVGETEETITEQYQTAIEKDVEAFMACYEIEDPEGVYAARLVEDFGELYPRTSFEVGEAVKDGDVYTVPVTIMPLDVIELLDAQLEVTTMDPEIEDFETAWSEWIIGAFEQVIPQCGYQDEPYEIEATVAKDDDGYWCVDSDSIQEAYNNLIPY